MGVGGLCRLDAARTTQWLRVVHHLARSCLGDQGRAAARAGLLDEEDEEDSHEQHAKMNEEKRLNERVAARVEEALAHARRTAAEQGHDQRQQHVAQQKGLAPIGTHMDLDAEEIYGGQLIHEGEENVMDEYPADLDNDEEIEPDDSISVAVQDGTEHAKWSSG